MTRSEGASGSLALAGAETGRDALAVRLSSLTAVPECWRPLGLYTMMTRIGGAPPFIGIITIAILELFAVGLGILAVKVARDGDSPFPFNLGITLIAIVAAAVQFAARSRRARASCSARSWRWPDRRYHAVGGGGPPHVPAPGPPAAPRW